jgi:hypothetical protein
MPMIVLIETRAGWMVAPSEALPLTRAYVFRPGVPVDVPDADFDLLTDCTLVEGRSFVPADADYAQPHIAAAKVEAPKGGAAGESETVPVTTSAPDELPAVEVADSFLGLSGDTIVTWSKPADPPRDKKGG